LASNSLDKKVRVNFSGVLERKKGGKPALEEKHPQ